MEYSRNRNRTTRITLFLFVLLASSITLASETTSNKNSFTADVIPVKRTAPVYPNSAALRGLSGWVIVEFSVSKTGKVENPFVVDSTSKVFHQTSLNAVRSWEYSPALRNGQPVRRENVQVQLTFELGERGYVGYGGKASTQRVLRQIDSAIEAKEIERAKTLISDFESKDDFNFYEITHIKFRKYMVAIAENKIELAWYELQRALQTATIVFNKKERVPVMVTYFNFAFELKRYSEALVIHDKLKKLAPTRIMRKLESKLDEIENTRENQIPFVVAGKVDASCNCGLSNPFWTYSPLSRNLRIQNTTNRKASIALRCDTQIITTEFVDQWSFSIPSDWGSCQVFVSGPSGHTFLLHEFATS